MASGSFGGMSAVGQRPDEGGGDEVHALDVQSRLLHGRDHSVDEVAVGGRHENSSGLGPVVGGVVAQDLRGENRLVGREGNDLLRLEPDGALDLGVGNPGKVELTGDDPEPGDADDDGVGNEAPVVPEPADGLGHGGDVLDLTVDDGFRRQPDLPEGDQLGLPRSELELGGTNRTGPYVKSYDLLHETLPL